VRHGVQPSGTGAERTGGAMHVDSTTGWCSPGVREALVRSLEIRRSGSRDGLTEAGLRHAFDRLCQEALANARPPEDVLEVFRLAWDHWFSRAHGDDPRDLSYYGTVAQCLDAYVARAGRDTPESTMDAARRAERPR